MLNARAGVPGAGRARLSERAASVARRFTALNDHDPTTGLMTRSESGRDWFQGDALGWFEDDGWQARRARRGAPHPPTCQTRVTRVTPQPPIL
jgi:hypothetical protein